MINKFQFFHATEFKCQKVQSSGREYNSGYIGLFSTNQIADISYVSEKNIHDVKKKIYLICLVAITIYRGYSLTDTHGSLTRRIQIPSI